MAPFPKIVRNLPKKVKYGREYTMRRNAVENGGEHGKIGHEKGKINIEK